MPIKLLTFTTLFPNKEQPHHGIFVENRLRHLIETGKISLKVVAPVPWFPFKSERFGQYGSYARVPEKEQRDKVTIFHPRYVVIPKIGMIVTPVTMALSCLPIIRRIIKNGYDFDVIDSHYYYPDGVAAVILGKILKKKVVITARGTDLNLIPKYRLPRKMILWAQKYASTSITVCSALKEELSKIGGDSKKTQVLRNGVDLSVFRPPKNRDFLQKKLGIQKQMVLSVGLLIKRKGHNMVIEAVSRIPELVLFIAGSGPEKDNLKQLVKQFEIGDRVFFLGAVPHVELKKYYGAADVTVLASSREGWANVLLESMACGTPVVATNIWGTPEVVNTKTAGLLCPQRSPKSIADTITRLLNDYPDRDQTRKYAEQFSWDKTTRGQLDLFSHITGKKI